MEYDIIFVHGELFFDHPLCGIAILKRLLEKHGYKAGVIEMPQKEEDITKLGRPKLFFAVGSGSIDSMVRNYTPMKKLRNEDERLDYTERVPPRAVTVYSNWIKRHYKGSLIVLGGTEASMRRFAHYDYWDNDLRRPILFDARGDIIAYGCAEKQIVEIARRARNKETLEGVEGTCIISKQLPPEFTELPSYDEVKQSKDRFCDMQNMLSNSRNLAQKIDNRYALQYKSPKYTPGDLDEYYEMPFTRKIPSKHLSGFEFSIVTHRGCIGDCNFCALTLLQGNRIISRSEESIIREAKRMAKMPHFKGNIDDLGGPSANMYGMDCNKCGSNCMACKTLDRSNKRLINLMRRLRNTEGIKKVFVRSGIRYDLASPEYTSELAKHHISGKLKVAPEHVNKNVLRLMNKDYGDFGKFMREFKKTGKSLTFYFMTAHPGSGMKEAKELAQAVKHLKNAEAVQVFTPVPMVASTCMYYTAMDPKTKKKIYVPYTYSEKKKQKQLCYGEDSINKSFLQFD